MGKYLNQYMPRDYRRFLVDAHGAAQDAADSFGLPQTVFYHPDYSYSWGSTGERVLKDRKTEQFVTWLPSNYFA